MSRIYVGSIHSLAICVLALVALPVAHASEGGIILKRVDATRNAPKDQISTMVMTIRDASGNTKVRKMHMKQMGSDLRLMKFQSPADVKGVGFLVRENEKMYLYMPEFGKVRRIASHVKNESFMGTDFSYNDVGQTTYADDYQAKVVKKDSSTVDLELKPNDPGDSDYSKLMMTVDTNHFIPLRIEYYDKKGKIWKVMLQEKIWKDSGYWMAHRITMTNKKTGGSTSMEMSNIRSDTGLKDKDFSRRMLKRSR